MLPGEREVDVATVVTAAGPTPFAAHKALCAAMSPDPLPAVGPVVGCNNWYYAYGRDFGPDAVLRDARTVVEYADGHPVRPYCVIDDGWTEGGGSAPGGPWDTGLPGVFDDMGTSPPGSRRPAPAPGCGSGRCCRGPRHPPSAPGCSGTPASPRSLAGRRAGDGRGGRDAVPALGYGLIKHDFSTYDVFGRFASHSPPNSPSPAGR